LMPSSEQPALPEQSLSLMAPKGVFHRCPRGGHTENPIRGAI
jgi:hypothetical protein